MRILVGTSLMWIALSAISDGVTTLVLPVRLSAAGGTQSPTEVGLITFVGLLAGMFIQPVAGRLSDRVRATTGRLAVLAIGVGLVLGALLALGLARTPPTIGLAFVLLSLALSVTQAPQQALIADYVPSPRRGRGAGLKGFADLLGAMLGFALLGSLLAGGDAGPALLAMGIAIAVLLGLVVLLLGRVDRDARSSSPAAARARVGILDAYRLDGHRDRAFILAVLARFAFLLGTFAVGRFLVVVVGDRLGLDIGAAAEAAGGLLAALALTTALGSLPAGIVADRLPRGPLMAAASAAAVLGIAGFAVASDIEALTIAGVLLAIGSALFGVANWATLVDLSPPEESARYLGIANFGVAGAAAVAGLFGLLIDAANGLAPGSGLAALFAAAAISVAAGGGLALTTQRAAPAPSLATSPEGVIR